MRDRASRNLVFEAAHPLHHHVQCGSRQHNVLPQLVDVADLGAMVYKAGPSFNFTEADIRETINSVLEPPLESARESYANQTWWPVVEVAWDGVSQGHSRMKSWKTRIRLQPRFTERDGGPRQKAGRARSRVDGARQW